MTPDQVRGRPGVVTLMIGDVPAELHAQIKREASVRGLPVAAFVVRVLDEAVTTPGAVRALLGEEEATR